MTTSRQACPRTSCSGAISRTGFCDTCGLRPPPAPSTPGPTATTFESAAPPSSERRSSRSEQRDDQELFDLPLIEPSDPEARVDKDPHVPLASRRCATPGCGRPVGQPTSAFPEGLEDGFCEYCGKPFSFSVKLTAGSVVEERYRVLGAIGRGGFGWVYLAEDRTMSDRLVALKGLLNTRDEASAQQAVQEARLLAELKHEYLVDVITVVAHPDPRSGAKNWFIALEYVPGPTLYDVMREAHARDKPIALAQIASYGMSLLVALEFLHGRGWLYCDLKPDNVIHSVDTTKLVDMGALQRIHDAGGRHIANPRFRVSERELDQHGATVRSDLYALGRTLSELYGTGGERLPNDDAERLVEDFFRATVKRATAEFSSRFVDAEQMRQQLGGVLRDLLSVSDGRQRPVRSVLFQDVPTVLDGDLAGVPDLEMLIATAPDDLPIWAPARLDAGEVAAVLAAPRPVDDDPPNVSLDAIWALDPEGRLEMTERVDSSSPEVGFARVAAYVALGRVDDAREALRQVSRNGDWRVSWYDAVLTLAAGDVTTAAASFLELAQQWPGEPAPKIARASCLELLGDLTGAKTLYEVVWRRDRAEAGAAFGLARIHLARGERSKAVAVLDAVPRTSRHDDAVRRAIVRARTVMIDASDVEEPWPTPAEVTQGVGDLARLPLDREARDRLAVRIGALPRLAARRGQPGDYETPAQRVIPLPADPVGDTEHERSPRWVGRLVAAVLADPRPELAPAALAGRSLDERTSLMLSLAYRRLAAQAVTVEQRSRLMDRAHGLRPRTWI